MGTEQDEIWGPRGATLTVQGQDVKPLSESQPDAVEGRSSRVVVIIPAYQPPPELGQLVASLTKEPDVEAAVVVDDGSGADFRGIFDDVQKREKVIVLRHVANQGKGAALKTGLDYAIRRFPWCAGVITADADGQHTLPDILRTARTLSKHPGHLVLGARHFGARAPLRSRLGNMLARWALFLSTGLNLRDTQTGLRGIPMGFVPELLRLRAIGYEFELDMLIASLHSEVPITEVPVATIYLDSNRLSHFNPLSDSMRVSFVFLRCVMVSWLTAIIDNLIFVLAYLRSGEILAAMGLARLIAGIFHYSANKRAVFRSRSAHRSVMPRYYLLLVCSGLASYGLIVLMTTQLGVHVLAAKLLAETVLFFVNFQVQRRFIFYPRSGEKT